MKNKTEHLLKVLILLAVFLVNANAQNDELDPQSVILSSSEKIVKGAPFSATAIAESVQMMFDGNKIVRSVKADLYRDSEGRFRRDEMPKPVGVGLFVDTPQVTIILDPVAAIKLYLDPTSKTVRPFVYDDAFRYRIDELEKQKRALEKQKAEVDQRKRALEIEWREKTRQSTNGWKTTDVKEWQSENKNREDSGKNSDNNETSDSNESSNRNENNDGANKKPQVPRIPPIPRIPLRERNNNQSRTEKPSVKSLKPVNSETSIQPVNSREVKRESLGKKTFDGIEAEGARTTTTYAAGTIGNERTFEIVYERWYSEKLKLIVYSKYSDPRFGEQIYRLTNIKLEEPDGMLFKLPAGFKIADKIKGKNN